MRYLHYKPTGIPCLPEIPEGWEMRPFKSIYGFGKGLPITKENLVSEGMPVVSYGQIHSKDNDGTTLSDSLLRFVDKSYIETNPQCLLQTGDMAIADTSEDLEGCGNAVVMDRSERVFAGYHTIIGRIKESTNAAFLAYEFCCNAWRSQIRLAVHGVKLYSITKQILSGTRFVLPPLSTQRAIVAFLDGKCGKLNRLVAAKEKEVALLKELKQSMIAEAVTRGVRKNRRLVPSGIPWLPEVPEGWEVRRAKYLFRKEQRPILVGDEIVTCFRDGEVTLRKNRRLSGFTEATDYSHYQHICAGDLVIHQMDAFAGSCGVSDSEGMGTPVLSVCTPKSNQLDVRYFAAVVRLMGLNGFIQSLYRGIRERSSDFRFETFAKQMLPVPPLAEQRGIVAHIEARAAKIDAAVAGLEKEIAALKEYKQRLIADVVTGQRRVA